MCFDFCCPPVVYGPVTYTSPIYNPPVVIETPIVHHTPPTVVHHVQQPTIHGRVVPGHAAFGNLPAMSLASLHHPTNVRPLAGHHIVHQAPSGRVPVPTHQPTVAGRVVPGNARAGFDGGRGFGGNVIAPGMNPINLRRGY